MKKRILSIMITICMLCVLMPTTVFAATTIDGQFNYSESDGKITITKYIGTYTTVNIPDTINGNPVTSIGQGSFDRCYNLRSITIPSNITSIGDDAFSDCGSLENITFEANSQLQSIGYGAFFKCNNITSITIPSGVTFIGSNAFHGCQFTNINIPSSVTSIGSDAFLGCSKLQSITVDPNNSNYSSVDGVLFNKDITELIKYPTGNISTSYSIPDSVTSIRNNAFRFCMSLKSVTFGMDSKLQSIGIDAFNACQYLESINIPNSVTSIGEDAFYDCSSLQSIIIPNNVTVINDRTFTSCNNLESIILSDKVSSIGTAAIPDTASQVKYKLDEINGEVTITEITLGNSKSNVTIPAKICGYDVVAVADGLLGKISSHTHVGGNATCQTEATCGICNTKYGDIGDHSYDWQSENGKYWKKCKYCGDETSKKDIPIISIDGANTVCMTQDYKFSFSLPENVTNGIYGYEFENKGEGGLDPIVENGKMSAIISADIYETTENSFKIIVDATTEDGFDFSTSKIVALKNEHSGGTATCTSQAICEYCGEKYGKLDSSNHHLEKVPAKEATVTEVGNQEYWYCKDCGKYFSDKDGKKSIELKNTIIQKLSPQMIEGIGQSITVGEAKDLIFRSNAAFSDFVRVELDGKILDKKYYTVKEGSTIVTLKADYVSTLSFGEHTIGIVSENGTAAITFKVEMKTINNNSPMTGDNHHMLLWIGLLFVSGITVMKTIIMNKKHSEN